MSSVFAGMEAQRQAREAALRYVQEELGLPNGRVLQTLATERRALVLCCDRYGYKTFVMRMDRVGDRWLLSDVRPRASITTTNKKEKLLDELPKKTSRQRCCR